MKKSAIISRCNNFRYELRRIWDDSLPPYVSGMLNPSTADAKLDDPTIARNIRRAEENGCGSLIVWNLGAGRATDPDDWKAMKDPVGPLNTQHIKRILQECLERNGIAVVGWGNRGIFRGLHKEAYQIACNIGVPLHCLGITKSGQPKHPLYIPLKQKLIRWPQ